MNNSQKEVEKQQAIRDGLILAGIFSIYDTIREKSQRLAMQVVGKAGDNKEYFQQYSRAEKFAIKTNKELRPSYLKRDKFSKDRYYEEYRTSYFMAKFETINKGISDGYLFKLPNYTKKQFETALNYPLSKLMNPDKLKVSRSLDIQQLYTTIISGVEQGGSLTSINKQLDIDMGFRDRQTGKWIQDKLERKGQQYKTMRILRTEIGRIRSDAEIDQWLQQQPIVKSELKLLAVRDNRTRKQSFEVDGRIANNEGKFLYPDGNYYKPKHTGHKEWDIQDREYTISLDEEYPPQSIIERDPKTNKNKVVPFRSASDWLKETGLKKNVYGEIVG